jgi:hypothetical protein
MNSTRLLWFEVFLGILGIAPPLIAAISSLDPTLNSYDEDHTAFTVLCFVTAGLISVLCLFPFRMLYVRDEAVLDLWKGWWTFYSILMAIFGIAVVIVCFASFGPGDDESEFEYLNSGVLGGSFACLFFTLIYPCVLSCVMPNVTIEIEDNHPIHMLRFRSKNDDADAKVLIDGPIRDVNFGQEAA